METVTASVSATNRRIIVIDDNEAIHRDFAKILGAPPAGDTAFDEMESLFFSSDAEDGDGGGNKSAEPIDYDFDFALQGQEGYEMVKKAGEEGRPYALAFVDMRMPPGWDGLETIIQLWKVEPGLQVVVCTAYSDHSWQDMIDAVGQSQHLLILKKPFDTVEIRQLASAMTEKWTAHKNADLRMDQMETLVTERTKEIESARASLVEVNSDLAQARFAADRANAAKTQFLANMSHEIRTPMTAILGYAEILSEPDGAIEFDERLDCLEVIQRNGRHLLDVINEILDLTKIEAGKMDLEITQFDLQGLLDELTAMFRVSAESRDLKLSASIDSDVAARMVSDRIRFKQVVINLIGNSIKFTQNGEINIRVRAADGGLIEFEVQDTGIGIAPDRVTQLFEPFMQAEASTARRFGGTGLGLALSQRIANLLGGSISVDSTEGKGSVFTLRLPSKLGVATHGERESSVEPKRTQNINLSGHRVLLVEDGPDNRRLVAFILRKMGAELTLVENGKLAVEAIERSLVAEDPFHVVLMDMHMPVMDGYEATTTVRNMGCDVPIIALTANALSGAKAECLAAGCDNYLTKPINRAKLLELVASFGPESSSADDTGD